ncbi:MAG: DUF3450 family protein [Planctomycetota bacterium]|jgi:hypothetical protein
MKTNRRRLSVLLAAVACLPAAPSVGGEDMDERAQAARRIRAVVEKIQRLRADRSAARAALLDEAGRLEARIGSLEEHRDSLEAENRALRADLEGLRQKVKDARAEGDRHRRLLTALARAAVPVAERIEARVRVGIPHRRAERAGELAGIARILRSDAKKDRAGALRRFCVAVGRELQLAATRELSTGEVDVGQRRRKHAYRARLGLVNELCVSEDGTYVGVAARGAEAEWRLLKDPEDRRRTETALACLRQRQPPRIAPLPFVLEAGDR